MKISVTKAHKISSESHDFTDEALSSVIDIVTDKKHKLDFLVEMSDGRSYEATATVVGCDNYHESMWLDNPINDIPQFSKDIESVSFPDLVFYEDYDDSVAAERENDESSVAIWIMYPSDRRLAEQKRQGGARSVVMSLRPGPFFMPDLLQFLVDGISSL